LHNIQSINGIKITDCIPLIALRDVENYATAPVVKYIQTKFDDSQNIFALEVSETNILFEHGSILFVNPNLQYNNEDFVIVKKISNLSFSIKKVIFDDEYYLQSIHQALDKKLYNINEYIVCGVIVSCLKNLKRTN
jgi:SOS-response transcriptional repressor LexA